MNGYYLVLGSNKNPKESIDRALNLLNEQYQIIKQSQIVIGESEDNPTDPDFLNVACYIISDLNRDELKESIRAIENMDHLSIDIDIVIHAINNNVLWFNKMINRYCHFLITMIEICPEILVEKKSIKDRLNEHANKGKFKVYTNEK